MQYQKYSHHTVGICIADMWLWYYDDLRKLYMLRSMICGILVHIWLWMPYLIKMLDMTISIDRACNNCVHMLILWKSDEYCVRYWVNSTSWNRRLFPEKIPNSWNWAHKKLCSITKNDRTHEVRVKQQKEWYNAILTWVLATVWHSLLLTNSENQGILKIWQGKLADFTVLEPKVR